MFLRQAIYNRLISQVLKGDNPFSMIKDCYEKLKTQEAKIDKLIYIPIIGLAEFLNSIENKKLNLEQYISHVKTCETHYFPVLSYKNKLTLAEKMRMRRDELIGKVRKQRTPEVINREEEDRKEISETFAFLEDIYKTMYKV